MGPAGAGRLFLVSTIINEGSTLAASRAVGRFGAVEACWMFWNIATTGWRVAEIFKPFTSTYVSGWRRGCLSAAPEPGLRGRIVGAGCGRRTWGRAPADLWPGGGLQGQPWTGHLGTAGKLCMQAIGHDLCRSVTS